MHKTNSNTNSENMTNYDDAHYKNKNNKNNIKKHVPAVNLSEHKHHVSPVWNRLDHALEVVHVRV
jgi:hypothetical protein